MKMHKLYEDTSKLSRKQMLEWCKTNIDDFSLFDNNTHREKYFVDEMAQVVYSQSYDVFVEINTNDSELPIGITCITTFRIKHAPNLKSFKNFPSKYSSIFPNDMEFSNCPLLDFNDFYYGLKHIGVLFIDKPNDNIKPQLLNKNQKWNILYYADDATLNDCIDISNYTQLNDIKRLILYPPSHLKNLSSILDTKIQKLEIGVSKYYVYDKKILLNGIANKYIVLGKDHIMDMTIELIDNGFEDEV